MKMIFMFITFLASAAFAQTSTSNLSTAYLNNQNKDGQFGVGIEVGSLAGLNLEYWLADDRALNGSFSTAFGNTDISVAHLWMYRGALGGSADLSPYIGLGALASFGSTDDYFDRRSRDYTSAVAVQIPLGVEFLPLKERFSIFAEMAPSMEVAPVTYVFLTADLGAKFYF